MGYRPGFISCLSQESNHSEQSVMIAGESIPAMLIFKKKKELYIDIINTLKDLESVFLINLFVDEYCICLLYNRFSGGS